MNITEKDITLDVIARTETAHLRQLSREAQQAYVDTRLTPRQLAEQRAELLKALKEVMAHGAMSNWTDWGMIRAAIAKAEGKE